MGRNYFYIYNLQKVGFISLALGMFISLLFGFIFGLILGTTQMPWGFGDFPTEEMKGRYGNFAGQSSRGFHENTKMLKTKRVLVLLCFLDCGVCKWIPKTKINDALFIFSEATPDHL